MIGVSGGFEVGSVNVSTRHPYKSVDSALVPSQLVPSPDVVIEVGLWK